MHMARGIDPGNFQMKDVSDFGVNLIPADLAPYREVNLEDKHGDHDLVVEYEGKKYFAGTLAYDEDPFSELGEKATMFGETKAHEDAKIRVLISIALSGAMGQEQIVVGQPIKSHKQEEKEKIISMLEKIHRITINGNTYQFRIKNVTVAAEGAAAYFALTPDVRNQYETIRIIDVGSGTVNLATIYQGRKIDKGSDTLVFGSSTLGGTSMEEMSKAIIRKTTTLKWKANDKVFVCGGCAYQVINYIQNHFKTGEVLIPTVQINGSIKKLQPVFANAVGFYCIARGLYG